MFYEPTHKALIYNEPDPARITRMAPDARTLPTGHIAVPANLYNCQVLRYLGLPVIPIMDRDYDWPIRHGRAPLQHQKVMANFMALHPRCFNLSDPGTMKTQAALWAADFVMGQYQRGLCRGLVVSTLSTLQSTWHSAIFKDFLGRRTGVVLHGSKEKRLKLLQEDVDFYIINYDGIAVIADELIKRTDIRLVIVDEARAYHDATTKRHKIARKVLAPRDYLWMMTGTPIPDGPLDAYGQAKLVNNAYGETFTAYKDRVMLKVAMFKWLPKAGAQNEAYKLMQPAVRFAIDDCVDLPPQVVDPRDIEFSAEQAKAYKALKNDLQLMTKSGPITAANEAVLRGKLIQISCGAIYDHEKKIHYIDASPRLSVLMEVIEQSHDKVIIFAPLTSVLGVLYQRLEGYSREIINGSVPPKKRSEIFCAFQQTESPRILIADPGTMSHGLDLFAATTIIWYAPTDKTELYIQANRRINRPGQTKTNRVVQLAATAAEREIFRRIENNESLQGVMLKMVEER